LILALDTASRFISLALHDGSRLLYEATWQTANNHTIELAPAIQRALAQAAITPRELTAVAVSQGPGSFTGLRIGLGVAKGLALAQHIALVAMPTLDITAAGIPLFAGTLTAVLQAGRGRICAQSYQWQNDGWQSEETAVITSWEQQIARVESPTLFAGEIDEAGRALLAQTERPVSTASGAWGLRRAGFLAERAWMRVRQGKLDDPATVTPIYLHQPGVPNP